MERSRFQKPWGNHCFERQVDVRGPEVCHLIDDLIPQLEKLTFTYPLGWPGRKYMFSQIYIDWECSILPLFDFFRTVEVLKYWIIPGGSNIWQPRMLMETDEPHDMREAHAEKKPGRKKTLEESNRKEKAVRHLVGTRGISGSDMRNGNGTRTQFSFDRQQCLC